MIDKVLRLSSAEKYDFDYLPEAVNLSELLHDSIGRMRAKAERFGVELVPELTDAFVWADRDNLVHVFMNLLDNGIKYNVQDGQVSSPFKRKTVG